MHNFFSSANVVHLQMDNIVALKRWVEVVLITGFFQIWPTNLELSDNKWDQDYCGIFTKYSQCRSRLLVQVSNELEQMETKPDNFQGDLKGPLDSQCRSLCLKGFKSGTNIYYMETRAIQRRDGAFQYSWKNLKCNAFTPFCLIGRVLRKVQIDIATLILITPA